MQIHFYVALFWYQLFLDNEDFLYFMLAEQRLNGVSKARLLAHLQPYSNKKKKNNNPQSSSEDPQSQMQWVELLFTWLHIQGLSPHDSFDEGLQEQVHADNPRFRRDSVKTLFSRATLAEVRSLQLESQFPQKILLTRLEV